MDIGPAGVNTGSGKTTVLGLSVFLTALVAPAGLLRPFDVPTLTYGSEKPLLSAAGRLAAERIVTTKPPNCGRSAGGVESIKHDTCPILFKGKCSKVSLRRNTLQIHPYTALQHARTHTHHITTHHRRARTQKTSPPGQSVPCPPALEPLAACERDAPGASHAFS